MKKRRGLWIVLAIVMIFGGVYALDRGPVLGVGLFLGGIAVLIMLSIGSMRRSGGVKDQFFHQGAQASQQFVPTDPFAEAPENVWDQLTKKQEESK